MSAAATAAGAAAPAPAPASASASEQLVTCVVAAMERIAPLSLADRSFDNVGLLVEAPTPRAGRTVIVAIDLTPAVADEILADAHASVAVIYHPVIFKPLKALAFSPAAPATNKAPSPALVQSILRLAAAGVSIYCPHTALDAAPGGMNDWLLAAAAGGEQPVENVRAIVPASLPPELELPGSAGPAGFGRSATFAARAGAAAGGTGRTLDEIVRSLKAATGLAHVQVGVAHGRTEQDELRTVAVCCGAGSSILSAVPADVYVTGEMSHHEVLAAVARGTSVILLNHSNSERGYLGSCLVPRLQQDLGPEWTVATSKTDHDPLQTR